MSRDTRPVGVAGGGVGSGTPSVRPLGQDTGTRPLGMSGPFEPNYCTETNARGEACKAPHFQGGRCFKHQEK